MQERNNVSSRQVLAAAALAARVRLGRNQGGLTRACRLPVTSSAQGFSKPRFRLHCLGKLRPCCLRQGARGCFGLGQRGIVAKAFGLFGCRRQIGAHRFERGLKLLGTLARACQAQPATLVCAPGVTQSGTRYVGGGAALGNGFARIAKGYRRCIGCLGEAGFGRLRSIWR